MKKTSLLILSTILLSKLTLAQTVEPSIEAELTKYLEAVKQKNNELVLDYYPPKAFILLSKKETLELMNKTKKDSTVTINVDSAAILSISNMVEMDGIKYALVNYFYINSIKYSNPNLKVNFKGDSQEFSPLEFTYSMMQKEPNINELTIDRQNNSIRSKTSIQSYAIYNPEYGNWKFLADSKYTQQACALIIPENVMKRLKKQ